MKRFVWWVWCALALAAMACGPSGETTTGQGGAGGETSAGGEGGTGGTGPIPCEALCEGGGGQGTTSTTEEACGVESSPPGCEYPDPLFGADLVSGQPQGVFGPLPGEETHGASASCFEPIIGGATFTRAVVGFASDPPAEFPIDAWAQSGRDPGSRAPSPAMATLESVEHPEAGGLTLGVYLLPEPLIVSDQQVPCVGARVADLWPISYAYGECAKPWRSWWYGLPANADGSLSWAMLTCPEDTTTADGTPAVLAYEADFPYGLRP